MAGKIRYLHQDKRGRFFARMGVPRELRDLIGKRELIKALGGDRQVALRALPEVVVGFNRLIDDARERLNGRPSTTLVNSLVRSVHPQGRTPKQGQYCRPFHTKRFARDEKGALLPEAPLFSLWGFYEPEFGTQYRFKLP